MKKILFFYFVIACTKINAQQLNIIPKPNVINLQLGTYKLNKITNIQYDFRQATIAQKTKIEKQCATLLKNKHFAKLGRVYVKYSNKLLTEEYQLYIGPDQIAINGNEKSIPYAIESLRQLIEASQNNELKNCLITDAPRFAYRGMHLDVGRHFQPISFIKKYLDYMAMYKFNTFHWHLTEDQGWRIEIKKYPKLTSVGGFRNGTIIGRYPGTGNTNQSYGGFYTQAEIKEIVQYAADRNIVVIPEIELPGHSSAAIAAYPELSCFPNQATKIPGEHVSDASKKSNGKLVQETWGVFEDVFCPSEYTFNFLQDVMDEVMQLFPSKYIHIGGDECPKEAWKKSAFCQQLIKEKGLKDEHELQSYFIQRIEKYLNSKGRNIIGWDEILEGGLAPNATVMSWRGEAGGIEAAKQKHNVIMTPGSHCYFDHSQSRNEDSVTIGGYTTVEKVYAYEPIPKELNTLQAKYILGAQGNVWTEYMNNSKKIEYQIFPRMLALSEVLWSDTIGRKWEEFESRLVEQMKKLRKEGINVSSAFYKLNVEIKQSEKNGYVNIYVSSNYEKNDQWEKLFWQNKTLNYSGMIVKEYDSLACHMCRIPDTNKDPTGKLGIMKDTMYQIPISKNDKYYKRFIDLNESGIINFKLYEKRSSNKLIDSVGLNFSFNKATAQKITLTMPPSSRYPGNGGAFGLVNGVVSEKGINSTEWLGFAEGQDAEMVIDLGSLQDVSQVKIHSLDQQGSWIYLPESMEIFISNDGTNFNPVPSTSKIVDDKNRMKYIENSFTKTNCRYIRVWVKNFGQIPSGKPGAGHQAWLFLDEVIVN